MRWPAGHSWHRGKRDQPTHPGHGGRPLVAIIVAAVSCLALAVWVRWQAGLLALGGVLLVAAGVRAILPARSAGLLAVRSRPFDVLVLAALGAAMVVLTTSLARI